MDRAENLSRMRDRTEPWDIVIIGGGATGVGCALDAASRGYDVLLLEQHDLGKGTSSRSTKLVHGGVRYLRQGNISLVRESLRERRILIQNAPHVVHRLAFIVPCYGRWQKLYYGAGLNIYDQLSGRSSLGRSRLLTAAETLERLPNLNKNGLAGGVLYFDAQFDDARFLIDLAQTADKHGAAIVNYARVAAISKNESSGLLTVSVETNERGRPGETGDQFAVHCRAVINAAGIFSDEVRRLSEPSSSPALTFSQGIHLVFDRRFLPGETAVMIPKTSDGRVLFCIPWNGYTLVGTTDTPVDKPALEPEALDSEIDFVLKTAGEYLAEKPTREDILSVFAGIRPLVKSGTAAKTSSLSRGHQLTHDGDGLVTITGGKWTTYRQMAEDTVDLAASVAGLRSVDSRTADLPIDPPNNLDATCEEKLHPDLSDTESDVIRAVRDELAQTVEDVLARRTRALFLNAKAAIEMAPKVAEIMADEIGENAEWVKRQLADFGETARSYEVR